MYGHPAKPAMGVECCRTCRHSEGGNKRECDGRHLFCQKEGGAKYMKVVAHRGKCAHYEPEGECHWCELGRSVENLQGVNRE